MLRAAKHFVTSPWLLVPILLAVALWAMATHVPDQGAHERVIGREVALGEDVDLHIERGWFGGAASVLRVEIDNRGETPLLLHADSGLALVDDRGGRYGAQPSADDPEITVPAHVRQSADILFAGPLAREARSVDLVRDDVTLAAGLPVRRTGPTLGRPAPTRTDVLAREVDRAAEIEATQAALARERAALADEIGRREETIEALAAERDGLAAELETARREVGDRLERLARAIEGQEGALATVGTEIGSLASHVEDVMAVRALAERRAAELEDALVATQAEAGDELARLEEQLDVARMRAGELADTLAEREAELAALTARLDDADALARAHAELETEAAGLAAALDEARRAQGALTDELEVARTAAQEREQALEAALAEAQAELERTRARIAELEDAAAAE